MRKRLLLIPVVLIAAAALLVVGTGASSDDGGYRVRVIFDNAFTVIPGLDVKIAGVKVGQVEALDLTKDNKAAVVLRIDDDGFQDFRTDAFCTIRPQGLIGEKFVECDPTLPRREGTQAPPELPVIPDGEPGAGQHLLPVERTAKPVDIDLINDTLRLPLRERLTIIVNELGTTVAGRGKELRAAIKRLDPGLRETDKVLKIVADQNKVLADLVVQSDRALAPLARDRESVKGFIDGADTTLQAQAQASDALSDSLEKLPTFLKELQPTMRQLEALSDEAIPVIADIGAVAPQLSDFIVGLGPFSEAGIPATKSLGDAADTGGKALIASQGTIDQLGALANDSISPAVNLKALTESLESSGSFERILSLLFYAAASQNGYDQYGYYGRAMIQTINSTLPYETTKNNENRLIGDKLANEPGEDDEAEAASASRSAIKLPAEIADPAKARAPKAEGIEKAPVQSGDDVASAQETVADYLLGGGQ
ncbi:MAG: MCE family protein [Solirubrobacteraceae bacterium]|nr:MCE family protein [Solirubrobacteraceae bacterium]